MSLQSKAQKLWVVATHPEIVFCKRKYLFVVSHMRSRSTVLSHILGSNPEIFGYKELHRSYKGRMCFINMQLELLKEANIGCGKKYLLDKILNNFTLSDWVLKKVQPKILFLLREPEATLKSIINMGHKTGVDRYTDIQKVVEYYCKRMRNLETLAHRMGTGFMYIESNDLIERPEETLQAITHWLDLKQPLKSTYQNFRDTGVEGYGDPLENIKTGELKKTKGYPDIEIPEHLLHQAELAYTNCRAVLRKTNVP